MAEPSHGLRCVSCDATLHGPYCHQCGEKVVDEEDFTLRKLMGQTLDAFANLDSKLFRTAWTLIAKPGRLSSAYAQGRRTAYMKPFQTFILVNILFFLLLSEVDVFRKPSSWWFQTRNDFGFDIDSIALAKAESTSRSLREISMMYDETSTSMAKAFILALIPFWGLAFAAMFPHKRFPLGKHILFTIHLFSFVLIAVVVWTELIHLISIDVTAGNYLIPIQLAIAAYLVPAIRHFYAVSWLPSILSAVAGVIVLDLLIFVYRSAISILSLLLL